jgi:hypothetical protein
MLCRVLAAFRPPGKTGSAAERQGEFCVLGYILLAIVLIGMAALAHYEAMQWTALKLLPRIRFLPTRSLVLVGVLICMVAHLAEVAIFAGVLYLLGGTGHAGEFGYLHYFNASMEAYTSLGYVEKNLTLAQRLISGTEALTGLVMIAWTASFTYLLMERYWRERHGWN